MVTVPEAFVVGSADVQVIRTDAGGNDEVLTVAGADEYRLEVEDFAGCVLHARAPEVVSHADTLANMRTIDALYASARQRAAVPLDD